MTLIIELAVVITAPIAAAAAPIHPITIGIVAPPVKEIAQIELDIQ